MFYFSPFKRKHFAVEGKQNLSNSTICKVECLYGGSLLPTERCRLCRVPAVILLLDFLTKLYCILRQLLTSQASIILLFNQI